MRRTDEVQMLLEKRIVVSATDRQILGEHFSFAGVLVLLGQASLRDDCRCYFDYYLVLYLRY